ncbi:NaeI family type II restriction endonuclease [Actinoplanes rectilineatus]|uniref:NaeI family type II restriction endonuclease n=1 Tax=Actinoplanes rectilineatus TaxID=113571 RepID=UPI0009F84994|nr:NaeI family type II restriction endonuclease [Actinoplanes rectilineatus]
MRGSAPGPGSPCTNVKGEPHALELPGSDIELRTVLEELRRKREIRRIFGAAVQSSVDYVLDGARTGRFDLSSPLVDSDERRTVGTKLQYHLLDALGLPKLRSPDTCIAGVPVDVKGTVGKNWSIPREAQCELCILVKIDAQRDTHSAWLMRTHRVWLYGGQGNRDQKRGIITEALKQYAVPLYPEASLTRNPLRLLDAAGVAAVFDPHAGLVTRLAELFTRLPNTVFARDVIATVGFQLDDPLRRARQAKERVKSAGLELLVGQWVQDRKRASLAGFNLPKDGWVAVPLDRRHSPSPGELIDP